MFSATFFINNRQNLVKECSASSLIIVTANGLMQRTNDSAFPFRQDSNFFYLTGVQEPNLVLVIDTARGEEFLILPKFTEVERYFGGSLNEAEIMQTSGVTTLYENNEGWQKVKTLLGKAQSIHTLLAPPVQFTRQERLFTSPARRLLIQKLRRLTKLPIHGLHNELVALRQIKQPEEVAAITRAIEITGKGFEAARHQLQAGMYEYELEAVFDYEFKKRKAVHGYAPPIVATGMNAAVLHYSRAQSKLQTGEFVLMDVGAEQDCYTADITRTYAVGAVSHRHQAIYQAVEAVHHFAQGLLKPGLSWREYVLAVDAAMGEELLKLKLITENNRTAVRPFFPHGISHSLGLDVHDTCDYQDIQEGMVLTVEPGIYLPGDGIGVRIEDDILITKSGAKNLSAHIPYA